MISSILLRNFKCFKDQTIPLAPITILSGINGTGKSSVIQSLLLLRQSHVFGSLQSVGALLNGPLISVGTADDAFYENMEKGGFLEIEIKANQNKPSASWAFRHDAGREMLSLESSNYDEGIFKESLFDENFHYLQAERIGPRTSFRMSNNDALKYNRIGNSGEFCAHYLAKLERQKIALSGALLHPNTSIPELREQTEAWISEVSHGARIHLSEHHDMDLVNLSFSFVSNGLPSRNFRPTNVGFGITYSLPIFVAVLSSQQGGLLIVENPEAHLHPKGQVAMGRFLALAAANGIQVIIESHSDHVLNGIRVAVKKNIISPQLVAIHFFERDPKSPHSNIISPRLDKHGRLDQWPEGFFDEWEKMLAELL
jgi:predicted ATPase